MDKQFSYREKYFEQEFIKINDRYNHLEKKYFEALVDLNDAREAIKHLKNTNDALYIVMRHYKSKYGDE